MSLLLRPRRHEDESLRGFFWRLAQFNGVSSPMSMYKLFFEEELKVSSLTKQMSEKFCSILPDFDYSQKFSIAEDDYFRFKTGFRICPYCFRDSAYIRQQWDHSLLPICVDHQCGLVDVQNIETLWFENGTKLLGSSLNTENSETLSLISYLQNRLGYTSTLSTDNFNAFDHLELSYFQRLIFLVGAFGVSQSMLKPRKSPIKSSVETAIKIIRTAAKVLSDWPSNIRYILGKNAPLKINTRRLFLEFGAIHRALKKELKGNQFEFIKQDYEDFLLVNWPDIIDKKSTWFDDAVRCQSDFITGTEFSKGTGVRLNRVVDWVNRGLVEGEVRFFRPNYRQVTIKKGQESYAIEIQALMNLKDVRTYLGLTKKSARSLLEERIIDSLPKGKDNTWAVQKSKVVHFLNRLKSNSLSSFPGDTYKSLTYLRRYSSIRAGIQISEIFRKMLESKIDYIYLPNASAKLTDCVYMEVEEYRMCTNDHVMVSIQKLAEVLCRKQEVIYHLINSGFIKSVNKGKSGRFVSKKAIDTFSENYAFLIDVANSLGTSSKFLVDIVFNSRIELVSGPKIDGGRQYLIRRGYVDTVIELYRSMGK
jgi:hypothetical protein